VAQADTASRIGAYFSVAFLVAAAVYGAMLGGHLEHWRTSITARIESAMLASGFGIGDVVVQGRVHTPPAHVQEALQTSQAQTIFGFDTRAARHRLEDIGWIRSARVMRLWPSTLVVELKEREPFARWRIRGHTLLIDRNGELLGPATPAFNALPVISGEGADADAAQLMMTLKSQTGISDKVVLAERIERRRWDLVMADGLRVLLPAENVAGALRLLDRLLKGVMPDGVRGVDLRVSGRIALRRNPARRDRGSAPEQLSATTTVSRAQRL